MPDLGFDRQQQQWLQGYFAGLSAVHGGLPFVGHMPGGLITNQPAPGITNAAEPPRSAEPAVLAEQSVYGTPVSELCEQELWKLEQHGLDAWDKLLQHADEDKFPDKADTFRFRYHGLFYVAPAQNAMTAAQLRGLADIAEQWGGRYAHVTTRANIQIREIAPRNMVKTILKLQEIGLTSKGSGVDNVRNITATPTSGIDRDEIYDTRPLAKGLHYWILNNRDLYDCPGNSTSRSMVVARSARRQTRTTSGFSR
jgi:ferredoxin-nitrite reductase